jgi:hypothetical protein
MCNNDGRQVGLIGFAMLWTLDKQGHAQFSLISFNNLSAKHMAYALLQDTMDLGSTIIIQMLKDFLNGKWKWIVNVIKVYLLYELHFIYVVRHLSHQIKKLGINTQSICGYHLDALQDLSVTHKSTLTRTYVLHHDFVTTFCISSSPSSRKIIFSIEPPPWGEGVVLLYDATKMTLNMRKSLANVMM